MNKDYEVGRGKPPVKSRFQKGTSGNPRGRPKKVHATKIQEDINAMFWRVFGDEVTVNMNGKKAKISRFELGITNYSNAFAKGDPKTVASVMTLLKQKTIEPFKPPFLGVSFKVIGQDSQGNDAFYEPPFDVDTTDIGLAQAAQKEAEAKAQMYKEKWEAAIAAEGKEIKTS